MAGSHIKKAGPLQNRSHPRYPSRQGHGLLYRFRPYPPNLWTLPNRNYTNLRDSNDLYFKCTNAQQRTSVWHNRCRRGPSTPTISGQSRQIPSHAPSNHIISPLLLPAFAAEHRRPDRQVLPPSGTNPPPSQDWAWDPTRLTG